MPVSSVETPGAPGPAATRFRWRSLSPLAWLRALTTVYSVPKGTPWLRSCPVCGSRLLSRRGPAVTMDGRCAQCGDRVGRSPWVIEVAGVAVVALLVLGTRTSTELPAYLWFAVLGVVLAVVDATVFRLPNALTAAWAGGTLVGLLLPAVLEHRGDDWLRAVLAGLTLTVPLGLLALLRPGSLGWGDVKAAAAVGIALGWLGWLAVYAGVLLASFVAFGYAMVLLVRRRAGRRTRLPLGPFLVTGAVVVIALLPATG